MTTIRIRQTRSISEVPLVPHTISSQTPEVQRRMARIASHFQQLDVLLNEIEHKIQSDERLKAIDDSIQEIELKIDGRRRRWRPRKPR